jgi:hypothetical protein
MAKKQTRRSISVSRSTYERLKSYCDTQGISMSQFVESRVGDFLGRSDLGADLGRELARIEALSRPPQVKLPTREERPKDPDIKLTADQIFTF